MAALHGAMPLVRHKCRTSSDDGIGVPMLTRLALALVALAVLFAQARADCARNWQCVSGPWSRNGSRSNAPTRKLAHGRGSCSARSLRLRGSRKCGIGSMIGLKPYRTFRDLARR
jgi:hypothetical protein